MSELLVGLLKVSCIVDTLVGHLHLELVVHLVLDAIPDVLFTHLGVPLLDSADCHLLVVQIDQNDRKANVLEHDGLEEHRCFQDGHWSSPLDEYYVEMPEHFPGHVFVDKEEVLSFEGRIFWKEYDFGDFLLVQDAFLAILKDVPRAEDFLDFEDELGLLEKQVENFVCIDDGEVLVGFFQLLEKGAFSTPHRASYSDEVEVSEQEENEEVGEVVEGEEQEAEGTLVKAGQEDRLVNHQQVEEEVGLGNSVFVKEAIDGHQK